jgi:DNA-binding transcriptional ArsR family regulator
MNSYSLLDANKTNEALLHLKSLAHPTRVKFLNLLLKSEQLTFSDFQIAFPDFNKELITKHLNVLFNDNLIEKEFVGSEVTYQAQQEKIEKIWDLVRQFS